MKFTEQLKNIWYDVKAMRSGYAANQYELGRYNELFDRHLRMFGNHYDAGNTGRLQDDWATNYNTPTKNFKQSWKEIIARSIKSVDNNPHTIALLNSLTSNIIGTGLRPRPKVKFKNGDPITDLNKIFIEGWKRYNDEWDATGRNTHLEAQKIRFAEIFRTGTVLNNKVKASKGSFLSIQNQIINVLRLDASKDIDSTSFSDPEIKNTLFGINLNDVGKPVSYWVQGIDTPVSADNMRHNYKQTIAEQYIGIPWITGALKYLWANENLIKDKLIASRIQSMISLFIPDSIMKQLVQNQMNSKNQIEWESGRIMHGKPNEKPEIIQADDSIKEVLEPLQKLLLHAIAMTLGISYQTVTRDLVKTNMASGRINTNEDRKTYRHIQKWFAKEVCQPDWNDFVFRMFLEGKIPGHTINDYLKNPWKYNQVQWQPPGFDFIDPQREASAAIDLQNANMLTMDQWYGERGMDWQDALAQIAEEKEFMKELKIESTVQPNQNNAVAKTAVTDDSDREEED